MYATSEKDQQRVASIRGGGLPAERVTRELFFELYDFIERSIQARLFDRGMTDDETSDHFNHFNPVLDYVLKRIFTPQAIVSAMHRFEPDRGSLSAWLRTRVVFVIRDWFKSNRRSGNTVLPQQLLEEVVSETRDVKLTSSQPSLEAALSLMTAAQRATFTLLYCRVRPLSPDDISAVMDVSGLDQDQIVTDIEQLTSSERATKHGDRERQLQAEIQLRFVQRQGLASQAFGLRKRLIEFGICEKELIQLELDAVDATTEQILEKYRRNTGSSLQGLLRKFELCSHDIALADRRLKNLRQENEGMAIVPLLSYGEIAGVLQCNTKKVNGNLHRARKVLENEAIPRNDT